MYNCGNIENPRNRKIIFDKNLLRNIKFVQEGKFEKTKSFTIVYALNF